MEAFSRALQRFEERYRNWEERCAEGAQDPEEWARLLQDKEDLQQQLSKLRLRQSRRRVPKDQEGELRALRELALIPQNLLAPHKHPFLSHVQPSACFRSARAGRDNAPEKPVIRLGQTPWYDEYLLRRRFGQDLEVEPPDDSDDENVIDNNLLFGTSPPLSPVSKGRRRPVSSNKAKRPKSAFAGDGSRHGIIQPPGSFEIHVADHEDVSPSVGSKRSHLLPVRFGDHETAMGGGSSSSSSSSSKAKPRKDFKPRKLAPRPLTRAVFVDSPSYRETKAVREATGRSAREPPREYVLRVITSEKKKDPKKTISAEAEHKDYKRLLVGRDAKENWQEVLLASDGLEAAEGGSREGGPLEVRGRGGGSAGLKSKLGIEPETTLEQQWPGDARMSLRRDGYYKDNQPKEEWQAADGVLNKTQDFLAKNQAHAPVREGSKIVYHATNIKK
mmetsp:Transcript_28018/g.71000  ORF Transcript_28018/g.71000 Transcript_28018/m.71000 type:complete len:446 (-) Transcript_28018:321-1658(-)